MKILIGDDHAIVRKGLKQIILDESKLNSVDEASNGNEVLEKSNINNYDIIILDISMPVKNGLETLKELKKLSINTPVLMLSIHPEEDYAIRALRTGASGYLSKNTAPEELIKALHKIVNGGKYITSVIADKLIETIAENPDTLPHEKLSDREFEVMKLIASGININEIGNMLSLSEKTISTYKSRILEKMNMKSAAEISIYAFKYNLIDSPLK